MERLYYTTSYCKEMQATVTHASEDRLRITLDQSVFYPTSGGQPHDLGTLNGIPVVDVIDDAGTVTHILAAPLEDSQVKGEIDWPRRYDHMQQHTGQHLLSAVFEELFSIPTLSFHMGDTASTIELGAKEITEHQTALAVRRATEVARSSVPVLIKFEEAIAAEGLRKTSDRAGILRIVEIPGIDRSACGGTHVAALAEILPLQIRETEKLRGNVRVSFVCGNRAIAKSQADFQVLARLARTLSTSIENIEPQVKRLADGFAQLDKHRQHLETEAAKRAGANLYAATIPSEDGIRRVLASESALDESAKAKAKAFSSQPKAIILIHTSTALLLACSPDSGVDAGTLIKKSGARGGGSSILAQASVPNEAFIQDLWRLLSQANQ